MFGSFEVIAGVGRIDFEMINIYPLLVPGAFRSEDPVRLLSCWKVFSNSEALYYQSTQ